MPEGQMSALGAQSFAQMKQQTPQDSDPALNRYVHCIVDPITRAAEGRAQVKQWEVVVFKDQSANAFALPGGKIGVHTGILPVAKTDAQLAAVLGPEVGHVIARHGAERVSQGLAVQIGEVGLSAALSDNKNRGIILGALALGAQFGYLLPYSRDQESEADVVGLGLMAQAGFDPRQSIELWKNMSAAGGGAPPEFLSTHPANRTRIENLNAHMDEAMRQYLAAKASGQATQCRR